MSWKGLQDWIKSVCDAYGTSRSQPGSLNSDPLSHGQRPQRKSDLDGVPLDQMPPWVAEYEFEIRHGRPPTPEERADLWG